MTEFALVLYGAFLVAAFGWRTWVQYRRTGDHGFRGFSGQVSASERVSGVLFVMALVAFLGAPIAALLGLLPPFELPRWLSGVGVVLALLGFALVLLAQLQMGASWRIGVDPEERTALVEDGLFSLVRNPIFSAISVFGLGFAMLVPNALSLVALVLGGIGLELQVRWIEEPYLVRTHGEEYARYAGRVGRFVPGVGRLPQERLA